MYDLLATMVFLGFLIKRKGLVRQWEWNQNHEHTFTGEFLYWLFLYGLSVSTGSDDCRIVLALLLDMSVRALVCVCVCARVYVDLSLNSKKGTKPTWYFCIHQMTMPVSVVTKSVCHIMYRSLNGYIRFCSYWMGIGHADLYSAWIGTLTSICQIV